MAYNNNTYDDSNDYWDEYDYYEDATYYGDEYYDANEYGYYDEDEEDGYDEYYEEADNYPSEGYTGGTGSGGGGTQGGGGIDNSYASGRANHGYVDEAGYSHNYDESGGNDRRFGRNIKDQFARGGGGGGGDYYRSSVGDDAYVEDEGGEEDWYGNAETQEDYEGDVNDQTYYDEGAGRQYTYAGDDYQHQSYGAYGSDGVGNDRSGSGRGQSWGASNAAAAAAAAVTDGGGGGVGAAASYYHDTSSYADRNHLDPSPTAMYGHALRPGGPQGQYNDATRSVEYGYEDQQYDSYGGYNEYGQEMGEETPRRTRSSLRELFFNKIRRRRSTKTSNVSPLETEAERGKLGLESPTALMPVPIGPASGKSSNDSSRPLPQLLTPSRSAAPAPPQAAAGHTIQARNLLWGSPSPIKQTSDVALPYISMPTPAKIPTPPLQPIPGAWTEPRHQRSGPEMLGFLAPRD